MSTSSEENSYDQSKGNQFDQRWPHVMANVSITPPDAPKGVIDDTKPQENQLAQNLKEAQKKQEFQVMYQNLKEINENIKKLLIQMVSSIQNNDAIMLNQINQSVAFITDWKVAEIIGEQELKYWDELNNKTFEEKNLFLLKKATEKTEKTEKV